MLVLLGLAIVPLLLKMLMGDIENDKHRKKWFLIFCGAIIIFVIGFRHESVGSRDTEIYSNLFIKAGNTPSLKKFFAERKVLQGGFIFSESLFYVFFWLLAQITSEPQVLIFITTLLITTSVMWFIYKHSKNAMLSVVMYICLGSMTFNINGMRQALAMAICLLAYDFATKKKLLPFAILILVAMFVHKTALFFFPVYFISHLKLNVKTGIIFGGILLFFVLFADKLAGIFDSLSGEDYAESESFDAGGYVTLLIYILTIVFSLIVGGAEKNEKDFSFIFFLAVLGGGLYLGRYISTPIYERMSYYFFYFVILLLPQSLEGVKKEEKTMVLTIICVLSLLLFAYRLNGSLFENYRFFWG